VRNPTRDKYIYIYIIINIMRLTPYPPAVVIYPSPVFDGRYVTYNGIRWSILCGLIDVYI